MLFDNTNNLNSYFFSDPVTLYIERERERVLFLRVQEKVSQIADIMLESIHKQELLDMHNKALQ